MVFDFQAFPPSIFQELLLEEILHPLILSILHFPWDFIQNRWCRKIFSINCILLSDPAMLFTATTTDVSASAPANKKAARGVALDPPVGSPPPTGGIGAKRLRIDDLKDQGYKYPP